MKSEQVAVEELTKIELNQTKESILLQVISFNVAGSIPTV
jgi:hypothetical protein